jgi:hypothetical protein
MFEGYSQKPTFEDELEKAKLAAIDYAPFVNGTFRELIYESCLEAYEGLHSVDGFVKFAEAIIKGQDGCFAKYNISAKMFFINDLKS